jgi:hypothetical protein
MTTWLERCHTILPDGEELAATKLSSAPLVRTEPIPLTDQIKQQCGRSFRGPPTHFAPCSPAAFDQASCHPALWSELCELPIGSAPTARRNANVLFFNQLPRERSCDEKITRSPNQTPVQRSRSPPAARRVTSWTHTSPGDATLDDELLRGDRHRLTPWHSALSAQRRISDSRCSGNIVIDVIRLTTLNKSYG